MRRMMKLAALLVAAALLMTGCVDFSAMMQNEPAVDPNATAAPTPGPMTAEMFTDHDAVYELYDQFKIGDTLPDLTERFGEPFINTTENGSTYIWENEAGYGVACAFYDNQCLRAKVVNYEDIRQFGGLSSATSLDNFSMLSEDHDFSMTCLALGGKPAELASIAQDSTVNPKIDRLFIWVDEKGDFVQVLFTPDEKLKQVSYSIAE